MMRVAYTVWRGHGAVCDDIIGLAVEDAFRPYADVMQCVQGGVDVISLMRGFDLWVLGGGTILGESSIPPFNIIHKWGDSLETPFMVFGPGWREPSGDGLGRTGRILELAGWAFVRGYDTSDILKGRLGFDVGVCGDPVISLDESRFKKRGGGGLRAALVVRNVPETELSEGVSNKMVWGVFAHALKRLESLGYSVDLIPLWRIGRLDDDAFAAGKVCRIAGGDAGVISLDADDAAGDFLARIQSYDFVLSERLHPLILCNMRGIPCIGVDACHDKMLDYASTVGFAPQIVMDRKRISCDSFDSMFKTLQEEKEIVPEIKRRIANIREFQKELIKEVASNIREGGGGV